MVKSLKPDKILFIKMGSFSHINDSIHHILKQEFKNHSIDVIDVNNIIKDDLNLIIYLKNLFHFTKEYGKDYIKGYKKIRDVYGWFLGTAYISLKIDEGIKKRIGANNYKFSLQTQCLFNAKICNIPHFIYTDHTTQTNLLYPDINPRQYIRSDEFIKNIESKIYNDAETIFTCGSLISFSLLNQYKMPAKKVQTVFAGSNVINNFIENDAKYSAKNILFVGVDWERKGGPILLKVFEKVLSIYKDATLTIVGCAPKGITLPNCKIIGKIPANEVAGYYNNATIFCLPTLREPFGIVFVEAMHYKLPIVANNIGSIPDMVINDLNGFLIDNDVEAYAAAICSLFNDPEKCKQLGENGFAYAQSKFTWQLVGKKMKLHIEKFL